MKRILSTTLLCLIALTGLGQNAANRTVLSPRAAMLLEDLRGKTPVETLEARYLPVWSRGKRCVQAYVTPAEGVGSRTLAAYGVRCVSEVNGTATALIPVERFADLVASGTCAHISLGHKARPLLDRVRANLGVDYIHQGIHLPQGYDGSGVVVGIVDVGFEYGHPSFYDTTGTTLRVKRVWQQRDDGGTAPAGFDYGSEYTTTDDILAAVTDTPEQGHGTHVAGIAAGSGAPDGHGRRYRGMAPGADIVMVGVNMTSPGIFDGIRYIHEYARSVGKPCVINCSLGTLSGPHDEYDDFAAMLREYLGNPSPDSLAVVVSAGNDGGTKKHLHKQFSAIDTVVRTFHQYAYDDPFKFYAECWGDAGDEFSVSVALHDRYSQDSFAIVMETPFMPSTEDSMYTFQFVSPRDTVYECYVYTELNPLNGRPCISVYISKEHASLSFDVFSLSVKSNSAHVHVWSEGHNLVSYDKPQYTDGDNEYTIGGVGANSDAVISVGSYATRTSRTTPGGSINALGSTVEGDLSYFSSRGPTYNGTVKPDICATGQYIVSSINTYYLPYYSSSMMFDTTYRNGEPYFYALMQGTSMSSPTATGIVALWMQRNPALSVDSVRAILHATGRRDRFTGDIPATGSNAWGWGKIDAFGGLPATSAPMYFIDAWPSNFMQGYITGGGRHPQGQHTLEAVAATGYLFTEWNDDNTDNPRVVDLTSDTTLTAIFEEAACDTIVIGNSVWHPEFTPGELLCWERFHHAGQGWNLVNGIMISMPQNGEVDNWLISPELIPIVNSTLLFDCFSTSADNRMAIVAITDAGDTVARADLAIPAQATTEHQVDLTAYAGQMVRLGFHHYQTDRVSFLTLTNVRIENLPAGIEEWKAESGKWKVYARDGRIYVNGTEGMEVRIYDMMGREIQTIRQSGNQATSQPLPCGVYVVKAGNETARRVVVIE